MASSGTVKISECYATESVSVESTLATGNDRGAGGFVGYGGGTVVIENSGFTGSVKAPGFAGAFAGNCWGTVTVRGSFTTSGVKFCTKKGLSDSYNNYGQRRCGSIGCKAHRRADDGRRGKDQYAASQLGGILENDLPLPCMQILKPRRHSRRALDGSSCRKLCGRRRQREKSLSYRYGRAACKGGTG